MTICPFGSCAMVGLPFYCRQSPILPSKVGRQWNPYMQSNNRYRPFRPRLRLEIRLRLAWPRGRFDITARAFRTWSGFQTRERRPEAESKAEAVNSKNAIATVCNNVTHYIQNVALKLLKTKQPIVGGVFYLFKSFQKIILNLIKTSVNTVEYNTRPSIPTSSGLFINSIKGSSWSVFCQTLSLWSTKMSFPL